MATRPEPRLVRSAPLPFLITLPNNAPSRSLPLLCFLHGYEEGAPTPIDQALTLHGPLSPTAHEVAVTEFVVIAAQMPVRGDFWHRHARDIRSIVQQVEETHGTDPARRYLTGFSFGGNGVFDIAIEQRNTWAALWPVDPTRVPDADPQRPIWLSSGEISRHYADAFVRELRFAPLADVGGAGRVYVDQGEDHVGTARLAYRDERIYRWLRSHRLEQAA